MLEEQAQVSRIVGQRVYIRSLQTSACNQCHQQQSCGTSLYAKFLPDREMALFSNLDLQVGDKVVIGIEEGHLLKASLFMYMLPLSIMLLIVGLVEGSEELKAVTAFLGLGAGLYLVHRLQRNFIRYLIAPPQIVRKL